MTEKREEIQSIYDLEAKALVAQIETRDLLHQVLFALSDILYALKERS